MVAICARGLQAWRDGPLEELFCPVTRDEGEEAAPLQGQHTSGRESGEVDRRDAPLSLPASHSSDARPRHRRWHVPRFLRHGLTAVLLVLVLEYLVLPKLALVFSRHSLQRLEHVNVVLIVVAFLLEAVSFFAYAELTLVVLPPNSVSLSKVWRINLASLTVSHIVPGGTAGGTGLSIRLLIGEGLNGADVGFATAIEGIGSAVLLNVMLWLALIISIPLNGFHPAYVAVAILSVLLLGFFASLVAGFASGEGWAVKVLRKLARRFHFIPQDKLERTLREIVDRLQAVARNPELIRRGLAWAAANWLFDAACLWVCLAALGYPIDPVDLFVAYGVGEVLAAIPITPGGLGTLEVGVAAVLASFGIPGAIAILAVIGWRFFNFWLPIPIGAGCYMSLRVERGASLRERRKAIGAMADIARSSEPDDDHDSKPDASRRSRRPGTPDPHAGPAVPPLG